MTKNETETTLRTIFRNMDAHEAQEIREAYYKAVEGLRTLADALEIADTKAGEHAGGILLDRTLPRGRGDRRDAQERAWKGAVNRKAETPARRTRRCRGWFPRPDDGSQPRTIPNGERTMKKADVKIGGEYYAKVTNKKVDGADRRGESQRRLGRDQPFHRQEDANQNGPAGCKAWRSDRIDQDTTDGNVTVVERRGQRPRRSPTNELASGRQNGGRCESQERNGGEEALVRQSSVEGA